MHLFSYLFIFPLGLFENNQVEHFGDAVSFQTRSTVSLWDKGESIHSNNII